MPMKLRIVGRGAFAIVLAAAVQAAQAEGIAVPSLLAPREKTHRPGPRPTRDGYFVQPDGRAGVMVELADPTAVEVYAQAQATAASSLAAGARVGATALVQAQLARIEQEQERLAATLTGPRIAAQVIYRAQRVYNGIAIRVDLARLDEIRALPGVRAVHPLVPKYPRLTASVPFIGAPQLWDASGLNVTGTGIKIGIIDTGIDYLHKDFGGSGNYRSDGKYIDPNWPRNAKVVGGYDFAGDNYGIGGAPAPDPDPMDCNGHGTHVAGIVAGYGVTSDGKTYPGPYGPSTPFSSLKVGPGVAPGAQIYALRVFGCVGYSDLVIPAIEWAIDPNQDGNLSDHLDVINMSLGAAYGTADDPDAVAADRAAQAGVVVVAAAGNEEDVFFVTGSPAVANRALSVASVSDSALTTTTLTVASPPEIAHDYETTPADFGPSLPAAGIAGDVVAADPALACGSLNNAAAVKGKIALIDRGTCYFTDKVKNAQKAGATAVIVANNVCGMFTMAGDSSGVSIPSVFVSQADGAVLKSKLPSPGVHVSLSVASLGDVVSDFSSHGPRVGDGALKPDIAAPGDSIFSALAGSPTDGVLLSGTSMATPHVSGGMALLRQLHPSWTVEELKAVAMNTAREVRVSAGATAPLVGPSRVGAGRLDLQAAAAAPAAAFNADGSGAVSVSFGILEVVGTTTLSRTVQVANHSSSPLAYTLSYVAEASVPGVTISFPGGNTLAVPAASTASFEVRLDADASLMKHTRDAGLSNTCADTPRYWLSEAAGTIALTPTSGSTLRVPVYAAIRPASDMSTVEKQLGFTGDSGSKTLDLIGRDVVGGSVHPEDESSLVTPLELQWSNPAQPSSDVLENIVTPAYVGVASDYAAQVAAGKGLGDTTLAFGVATQADWPTPNVAGFDIIFDTNMDGYADYHLFTWNQAMVDWWASGGDPNLEPNPDDSFVTILCNLVNDSCTEESFPNFFSASGPNVNLFDTNLMVLQMAAADLGLTSGHTKFKYQVRTFLGLREDSYPLTDATATFMTDALTYDVAHPGLSFSGTGPGALIFGDRNGSAIAARYDRASFQAAASKGALLLHHHNLTGQRAQVLTASFGSCSVAVDATVPATVALGSPATFQGNATAASCSDTVSCDWDFGDGSPHATGQNPTHTYTAAGRFTWRVVASAGAFTATKAGVIGVYDPRIGPPRRHLGSGH